MSRYSFVQTNFTAGEISPKLLGRTDFDRYPNGCQELVNFIIMPHGGITRRMGTYYTANARYNNKNARLIPFIFSTVQAYIIEMGDQYFRFYKDNGQILSLGVPYTISSTYLESELWQIGYAQSADVLYIAHPNHPPAKLTRTSDTSWTLSDVVFEDGPYLDQNTSTTTLTPSATTGAITITASASTFVSSDVGRHVRMKHSAIWGWAKITAYTDATHVSATVYGTFGGTGAVTAWALGAWGSALGYPSCVTFYEDRLIWAGSSSYPQTVWMSKSGDYESHSPTETDGTVIDDDAIIITLLSDQVNSIQWIVPDSSAIVLGTSSGEWGIAASNNNEALTPTNVRARPQTTRGSKLVTPEKVDGSTLYVQKAGRKIRELIYDFQQDVYVSTDLTILSEHITRTGVVELAYQQEPYNIIWGVLADGSLIGLTYNREQKVIGWHRHTLGGTDVRVVSVAVIPSADDTYDELWLLVERTINGATVKYVEYMRKDFDPATSSDYSDSFFVDCGLAYSGAATATLSGLSHLINEDVDVLAEYMAHPQRTVDVSGQITLNDTYTQAFVGLPIVATMRPVDPEVGGDRGTAQGQMKRANSMEYHFYQTASIKFGRDAATLEEMIFRDPDDPTDAPIPLFTGIKHVEFPGDYDRKIDMLLQTYQPYPCTLLSIIYNGVTY